MVVKEIINLQLFTVCLLFFYKVKLRSKLECQATTVLMERLRSVDEDYELEKVDDTGHCQFDAIAKQVSFFSFFLIAAIIPTATTRSLA